MTSSPSPSPATITPVPGPWTLKGTIYTFMTYTSAHNARSLREHKSWLYAPLERTSAFATAAGTFVGGLGMVQVIRYTASPVGPYDEIVVVPGAFEREETVVGGEMVRKRNLRCTRIYVSQEKTCWNGRKNWNIPKHLADFKFTTLANGATCISVFPRAPDASGIESLHSTTTPFFTATFKPIPYLPAFPLSTGLARHLGLDIALVQPPLPAGRGAWDELPGTERDGWRRVNAVEWTRRCRLGWWDLRQGRGEGEETPLLGGEGEAGGEEGVENWWPGLSRWQIGAVMENATIDFPAGERWD